MGEGRSTREHGPSVWVRQGPFCQPRPRRLGPLRGARGGRLGADSVALCGGPRWPTPFAFTGNGHQSAHNEDWCTGGFPCWCCEKWLACRCPPTSPSRTSKAKLFATHPVLAPIRRLRAAASATARATGPHPNGRTWSLHKQDVPKSGHVCPPAVCCMPYALAHHMLMCVSGCADAGLPVCLHWCLSAVPHRRTPARLHACTRACSLACMRARLLASVDGSCMVLCTNKKNKAGRRAGRRGVFPLHQRWGQTVLINPSARSCQLTST